MVLVFNILVEIKGKGITDLSHFTLFCMMPGFVPDAQSRLRVSEFEVVIIEQLKGNTETYRNATCMN